MSYLDFLSIRKKFYLVNLFLIFLWCIQLVSRFLWTGHYYGRTNIIYFTEDTVCYVKHAYQYAGIVENVVNDLIKIFSLQGNIFTRDEMLIMLNSRACDGVEARIMLSYLASFFVNIFGPHAIWIIPVICWLLIVLVIANYLMGKGLFLGTLISGSLVISSSSFTVWAVSGMTDVVLSLFVSLAFISITNFFEKNTIFLILFSIFFIYFAALTRQSWPYFFSIGLTFIVFSFYVWKKYLYLLIGFTYIFSSLITFLFINRLFGNQNSSKFFRDIQSLLPQAPQVDKSVISGDSLETIDNSSLAERFFGVVANGPIRSSIIEIQGILLRDTPIVLLVLMSFIALIVNLKKIDFWLPIVLLGTGLLIGALNTNAFHFRFMLPAIGPLMYASATIIKFNINWTNAERKI